MMESNNDKIKSNLVKSEKNTLTIFKTDADRYKNDISLMSDFFEGYIQKMCISLKEKNSLQTILDFPVSDVRIINDIISSAEIIKNGTTTLIPDFDSLPYDVRLKLKKGIYKIGDSKQVDGNVRAVILDENNVKVKEITLKKVINNLDSRETIDRILNQAQMRQLYTKLIEIQELQNYQIERDRDRNIIVPFLDARDKMVKAETINSKEEQLKLLKEADDKITTALHSIYTDMVTTSKSLAKCVSNPFKKNLSSKTKYMEYLISDLQIATKYIGVQIQLLEYIGEINGANPNYVFQEYQHALYDFFAKPVMKNGMSASDLLQDYFPYDKNNKDKMNFWYKLSEKMKPVLESSMEKIEVNINNKNEIYIVSVEDIDEEKRK